MSEKKHITDDEISLKEILLTIKQNKWLVIGLTFFIFLIATIFVYRTPNEYESTALIQVENQSSIVSSLQGSSSSNDLSTILGYSDRASASQIEAALLQSRFILQPTIKKLSLNIAIKPRMLPIFGKLFYSNQGALAKPFLWLSKYAWGGERLVIKQFDMPKEMLNTSFILKAGGKNSYKLLTKDGDLILEGKVGFLAKTKKLSDYPNISILVSKLVANNNTEFYVSKRSIYGMVDSLAANITIRDLGQNSKTSNGYQTGILNVAFKGFNQDQTPIVLNTIIALGTQKNSNKKSAEINKTLTFLNKQVPILKRDLDKSETALSNYKTQNNAIGIDIEKNILLQNLTSVGKNLEELKLKKQELLRSFTNRHPLIIAINQQLKQLNKELRKLEAQVTKLPKAEQKILGLERDVKVKEQLYILLLNKIQELQVLSAGIMSDVRILDRATPAMPLPSKASLMLLGSIFFGFILSLAIIFIRRALTTTIDNPDQIEERLNIPTFAVISHSKSQEALSRDMKRKLPGAEFVLAKLKPKDIAIEGLRSLRTIIHLSLQEAKNNILVILGSGPCIGKSFISSNLAHIMANNGKKILLIDTDLRKGKIHHYLGKRAYPGLSDFLLNKKITLDKVIRSLIPNQLDFISCGTYPENPFDLISLPKFKEIIQKLSTQYDLVIIDTPPLLAVADALIITQYSSINLMVIGLGIENLSGIEHCVKRFAKNGTKIDGLIFNNAKHLRGYSGHGNFYYYAYENKE